MTEWEIAIREIAQELAVLRSRVDVLEGHHDSVASNQQRIELERLLEAQYRADSSPGSDPPEDECEQWRRIRREAATRRFGTPM